MYKIQTLVIAQVPILESKVALLSYTPAPFPVEIQILALLVFVCHFIRLGMPLEPCQELDVEPPGLLLQLLRR